MRWGCGLERVGRVVEGQEGEEVKKAKKKNKKQKDQGGIEDMRGIDGMIMVKLGHEGKMRRFRERESKGGQVTYDGGQV